MSRGYYKAVCDLLQKHGYRLKPNGKGSHQKWESGETGKIILVPFNLKSRHTANAICKDIGIAKQF